MRPVLALALLATPLLAGCLGSPAALPPPEASGRDPGAGTAPPEVQAPELRVPRSQPVPTVPPVPRGLAADCTLPGAAPRSDGACVAFLDPTPEPDREAHLAAHPGDPRTVLVTWREGEFRDRPRIQAALTRDGGATWDVASLADPALDGPLGEERYRFDSIAAFASDGTAYVLYGEAALGPGGARTSDGMTLARRAPDGPWTFQRFGSFPLPLTFAPDYMDLAVAPDTGDLYVVAQNFLFLIPLGLVAVCGPIPCAYQEGVWLWRSQDGGATWSDPALLAPTVQPVLGSWAPRVAAGPGGLVVASLKSYDPVTNTLAHHLAVSRDGGATFTTQPFLEGEDSVGFLGDPLAIAEVGGTARIAVAQPVGREVQARWSDDAGATWSDVVVLGTLPEGAERGWTAVALAPDGALGVLQRWGGEDRFGIELHRVRPGWAPETILLADASAPGTWVVGDDYGGLAWGADGALWAAWSDPRDDAERVALARAR